MWLISQAIYAKEVVPRSTKRVYLIPHGSWHVASRCKLIDDSIIIIKRKSIAHVDNEWMQEIKILTLMSYLKIFASANFKTPSSMCLYKLVKSQQAIVTYLCWLLSWYPELYLQSKFVKESSLKKNCCYYPKPTSISELVDRIQSIIMRLPCSESKAGFTITLHTILLLCGNIKSCHLCLLVLFSLDVPRR